MEFLKRFGAPFLGFVFISLIAFGASIQYGFSIIDDQFLIVNNLHIRGVTWQNLVHIFTTFDPELYIPFTLLSFQINYVLGGLNAGIYHFTNILLHAGSATVLFWILKKCTDKTWIQVLGALLFLLHPLNTEAVVWVAGRKDVLSTFFALLSVGFLLHEETKRLYWISILFFAFALLSKASVLTLPIVLLLLGLFRKENSHDSLRKVAPFIGLSVLFGIIALFGKERVVEDSMPMETVLMAGKSTMFYVQKLLIPVGLNPVYPYSGEITITNIDFWLPLGLFIGITTVLIWYFKRNRWPLFGWLSYVLLLSPTFLNFQKGGVAYFAVDRYAYLSLIPILILIALGVGMLHEKLWRHRSFVMGGSAALVLTLGILTMMQVSTWQSDEVLLKRSIKLYPDNVLARTSIASLYRQVGDTESETLVFTDGQRYGNHIEYVLGLGSIEERKGNFVRAKELYEQARLMDAENPEPLFYLGVLAELQGNEEQAKALYLHAIELDSSYVSPLINLGAIESDNGNLEEAEKWFREALVWSSGSFELQYNLGKVLEEQGNRDEALQYYKNAYALLPTDLDIALTYAYRLYERGDYHEADDVVTEYLRLDPTQRTALRLKELIESAYAL